MSAAIPTLAELLARPASELAEILAPLIAVELERRARQRETADAAGLSALGASKLAHRRRSDVTKALACGTLAGQRVGSRWVTSAGAVRAWIDAGCPTKGRQVRQLAATGEG